MDNYHSCAGCGAKSWSFDGRCDYCGGNVKKVINIGIANSCPPRKIETGMIDDEYKKFWIDCQLGVNLPAFGMIHAPGKVFIIP